MPVTITWIRAYHTRRLERADAIIGTLHRAGLVTPLDDTAIGFFDIQALRSSHFASALGPALGVRMEDGGELMRVRSHVLAHASGFLVLRLTLSSDDNPSLADLTPERLRTFERMPWNAARVTWQLAEQEFEAGLREALNVLFLVIHEQMVRGRHRLETIVEQARDTPLGNRRLQELATRGELSHPLPVSFGTIVEVVDAQLAGDLSACVEYVDSAMQGAVAGESPASSGVVDASSARPWYVFENQAFVFTGPAEPDPLTGVYDPDRLRLLEFLTLRRGALRSIQRDTQRVLTGGRDVSRRRIDEWRLLVATTTDDYVLHDRISQLLVPLKQHLRTSTSVRDPHLLEAQVRQNIDSFQARIDLASQSVSTLIGALFAVVAAVVGVGSVLKVALAERLALPLSELPDRHPWLSSGVDIVVTVGAFVVTWLLIRQAGNRVPALRPFRSGRRLDRPEDSAPLSWG
jgi:hypothetical protein